MDLILLEKVAVAAAGAMLLWWRLARARRREAEGRGHMLDAFLPVAEGPILRLSPWRYINLKGRLAGRPARIDLIPDTLVRRSLPTLWLQVRWARPHRGWLCVTTQWNGAEYFSDDADAGTRLVSPAAWPSHTMVRGHGQHSSALLHQIEDLDLRAYPSLKQLVFSGDEVRVVLQCARGDRAVYRVLRSGSFPADCVTPAVVDETMDVLRAVDRVLRLTKEAA